MNRRETLAALAALGLTGAVFAQTASDDFSKFGPNAPWVPTPDDMIDIMLKFARVSKTDVVCDLGSGDGRIPIVAAKTFGARGLGIEIDPELVATARRNAERAGVAKRVQFIQGNVFMADFRQATVITLYLLTHMNDRLRPRLLELRPGTRIVAHNFGMNDWDADEVYFHNETRALLWFVPAKVDGRWTLQAGGRPGERVTIALTQQYQRLAGEVMFGTVARPLRHAELRGARLAISVTDPQGDLWVYHGTVTGNVIVGHATSGAAVHAFRGTRAESRAT